MKPGTHRAATVSVHAVELLTASTFWPKHAGLDLGSAALQSTRCHKRLFFLSSLSSPFLLLSLAMDLAGQSALGHSKGKQAGRTLGGDFRMCTMSPLLASAWAAGRDMWESTCTAQGFESQLLPQGLTVHVDPSSRPAGLLP